MNNVYQEMQYSKSRGTWNLFVNGEWYMEGTYEEVNDAFMRNYYGDDDEELNPGYEEY